VCKQLESPWKPDDRSGSWVKMKPEYTGQQELDCVIIAVYLGGGSRGGQVGVVCEHSFPLWHVLHCLYCTSVWVCMGQQELDCVLIAVYFAESSRRGQVGAGRQAVLHRLCQCWVCVLCTTLLLLLCTWGEAAARARWDLTGGVQLHCCMQAVPHTLGC
jgi:hypothetical protein